MFSLTVLGSSGMFATAQRAASGYLFELGDAKLWIDAGSGTWRHMLEYIPYEALDGVILSHRHPDHVTDIFQAFHARMYGQTDPLPPIPLWAPGETLERITGFSPEMSDAFVLEQIGDGDSIEIEDARVTFLRMAHPPETLGMRIESGDKVVAYSSDTGPAADFEKLAGGADVFICEATLQSSDEPWEGHMTGADAGRAALRCGAGRLVVTHLPPGRDHGLTLAEAQRESGDAAVQLAADGLRLEL